MSKHQIGFWILIVAVAVHVVGNAQKFANAQTAGTPATKTDIVYYAATGGLVAGVILLWGSIKGK